MLRDKLGIIVVAIVVAVPSPYKRCGKILINLVGILMALARPNTVKSAANSDDSESAPDNRSTVTGPPMRIPTRKSGKVIVGRTKSESPGIGTPIRIAKVIRMASAIAAIRKTSAKTLFRLVGISENL